MIVVGADVHKQSHTLVALDAQTGAARGQITIPATPDGADVLIEWAAGLDRSRVFAIEDCRQVSGALERRLIGAGEQVVRIAPGRTHLARRGARERGKSDPIDAEAIARAALAHGIERLPDAHTDHAALEIRVLIDHHDQLVAMRTGAANRLRWQLHGLCPDLEVPSGGLDRAIWQRRVARRLSQMPAGARVRVARSDLSLIRRLCAQITALCDELHAHVTAYAPGLTAERGIGPLIAARIIGEIQGVGRFASEAKLARMAGLAPIPASSGRIQRHRLDRGGNRRLNCAFHRLALTKARTCPETRAYIARRRSEGKTYREALRCLKRLLARRVYGLLKAAEQRRTVLETQTPMETQLT